MLLSEKAIYWQQQSMLIIADAHFGKSTHFRKAGIPVPKQAMYENWQKLFKTLIDTSPKQVVFLGDLFHSKHNSEWTALKDFIQKFSETDFILVLGNHDILPKELYENTRLQVIDQLDIHPFSLTHEPTVDTVHYNLAGHIHPCVTLRGAGKQSARVSCFYFGQHNGLLPAFGSFTGNAKIKVSREDVVFGLVGSEVVKLS